MLFAIVNAGFIYGVIWVFERKRRELQCSPYAVWYFRPPREIVIHVARFSGFVSRQLCGLMHPTNSRF